MQCLAMPVFKTILGHGLAAKTKVYTRTTCLPFGLAHKEGKFAKKVLIAFFYSVYRVVNFRIHSH